MSRESCFECALMRLLMACMTFQLMVRSSAGKLLSATKSTCTTAGQGTSIIRPQGSKDALERVMCWAEKLCGSMAKCIPRGGREQIAGCSSTLEIQRWRSEVAVPAMPFCCCDLSGPWSLACPGRALKSHSQRLSLAHSWRKQICRRRHQTIQPCSRLSSSATAPVRC